MLLIHGGAGRRAVTVAQAACVETALAEGQRLLMAEPALSNRGRSHSPAGGSGLFNAGRGSNRQLDGVRRMDASMMEGRDLRAGAVASIEGYRHPITAARLVMEKNGPCVAGPGNQPRAVYSGLGAPVPKRTAGPQPRT
ncbi:MAG: isoaspartyl peptidase/L-asparaginase [Nitrospira sp.]|nr:isoaspartyl peptidase/L-asparaginase [Nitrospira sp.]